MIGEPHHHIPSTSVRLHHRPPRSHLRTASDASNRPQSNSSVGIMRSSTVTYKVTPPPRPPKIVVPLYCESSSTSPPKDSVLPGYPTKSDSGYLSDTTGSRPKSSLQRKRSDHKRNRHAPLLQPSTTDNEMSLATELIDVNFNAAFACIGIEGDQMAGDPSPPAQDLVPQGDTDSCRASVPEMVDTHAEVSVNGSIPNAESPSQRISSATLDEDDLKDHIAAAHLSIGSAVTAIFCPSPAQEGAPAPSKASSVGETTIIEPNTEPAAAPGDLRASILPPRISSRHETLEKLLEDVLLTARNWVTVAADTDCAPSLNSNSNNNLAARLPPLAPKQSLANLKQSHASEKARIPRTLRKAISWCRKKSRGRGGTDAMSNGEEGSDGQQHLVHKGQSPSASPTNDKKFLYGDSESVRSETSRGTNRSRDSVGRVITKSIRDSFMPSVSAMRRRKVEAKRLPSWWLPAEVEAGDETVPAVQRYGSVNVHDLSSAVAVEYAKSSHQFLEIRRKLLVFAEMEEKGKTPMVGGTHTSLIESLAGQPDIASAVALSGLSSELQELFSDLMARDFGFDQVVGKYALT
ncbi:hypothetical protein BC832DRAFT_12162 [Gaertneriomyces semiglobifer]|nr:hypothetical protein BC832DRAFT_12162 [Gaertneriomyces semiglobifer]